MATFGHSFRFAGNLLEGTTQTSKVTLPLRIVFDLTPRLVRRALIPASYLIFFAGMMASSATFYRGKSFDLKAAVISDLMSPEDNPHGYGVAAAATAVSGILLAPTVILFCRQMRKNRPKLVMAGAVMFAVGLGATIVIGVLSPFTVGYSSLHIQLAYIAFIGICAGTVCHLVAARATPALIVVQCGVLLVLVYLYVVPDFFTNDRLLTSLAFWEWILCVDCGVGLWVVAKVVERHWKNS
jgi:hypothetical protein